MTNWSIHRKLGFLVLCLVSVTILSVARNIAAQNLAEPSGTIRGRVIDNQGSPIDSVEVTVVAISLTATTNSDGNFEFAEIPQGIYSLKAVGEGYAEATSDPVEVVAGSTTRITITLVPRLVALRDIEVTASASLLAELPTTRLPRHHPQRCGGRQRR